MAGTEIDIVGGPAVFRPQADGTTLAFYKRTDKVDSALWSADNSSVLEQASYTPEQYEQYRQDHPELDLPAFNFDPPPLTGGYRGTGNTVGEITGEAPGNAGKANASRAANPEVDKNALEQAKEGMDAAIDDWVERSGYSTGAMIGGALAKAAVEVFMPTAYWELIPLAKAGKIASKGAEAIGDLIKTEKAAEAGKDAGRATDATKADGADAPRTASGQDGGKIRTRKMKEVKVRCFKAGPKTKNKIQEYDRQLKGQEDGLNNLTVQEYLEGRERFAKIKRKGTGAAQREARQKYTNELARDLKDELIDQGIDGAEAKKIAEKMAANKMKTLAALHNPDLSAGGKDTITDFGDRGVNSSIGGQWPGRVEDLDKAALGVPVDERGTIKMNVKLKRCP